MPDANTTTSLKEAVIAMALSLLKRGFTPAQVRIRMQDCKRGDGTSLSATEVRDWLREAVRQHDAEAKR